MTYATQVRIELAMITIVGALFVALIGVALWKSISLTQSCKETLQEASASDDELFITSSHQLPSATLDVNYFCQLHAVGAKGKTVWMTAISTPQGKDGWTHLPYGLTLSTDGLISGKPKNRAETTSFWVLVGDEANRTQVKRFTIKVVE